MGYEAEFRRRRARRRALLGIGLAAAGLLAWVIYAVVHRLSAPPEERNPLVNRDNYLRIKPGMALWEVNELLGPGTVTDEEGVVIDAAGNFKRWSRHGYDYHSVSGKDSRYNGQTVQEMKQVIVWRWGKKAIIVTFFNEKVIGKDEQSLIGE